MKTKRFALLFAVLLIFSLLFSVTAAAEEDVSETSSEKGSIVIGSDAEDTLRLDSAAEIGNLIEITPHAARVCDTLGKYGFESDEKNEFVIIDFDICNISKDMLDLEKIINANLLYKDDYSFEVYDGAEVDEMYEQLLGTWEGLLQYYDGYRRGTLVFSRINEDGELEGTLEFEPYEYGGPHISEYSGKHKIKASYDEEWDQWKIEATDWIDNPYDLYLGYYLWFMMAKPGFLCGYNSDTGSSICYLIKDTEYIPSTELDVLEETSYSLIFKCPNRVAQDLDNCALYISVDDEVYEVPLQ